MVDIQIAQERVAEGDFSRGKNNLVIMTHCVLYPNAQLCY